MFKDPVCGMMVDENNTRFMSEHEGVTYYFCSKGCKDTFEKDPRRYPR